MDKISLTKRVVQIDAENLIPLIDLFLTDSAKQNSAITIHNQRYQLSFLRRWWSEVGPETGWILTKDSFTDFLTWLEAQPNRQGKELSLNTMNRALKLTRQILHCAALAGCTLLASEKPNLLKLIQPRNRLRS